MKFSLYDSGVTYEKSYYLGIHTNQWFGNILVKIVEKQKAC